MRRITPPRPRVLPGATRLAERAMALHMAGQIDEAIPLYRRVLTIDPQHVAAFYGIGLACFQLGEHEAAIRMMRQVVARRPDFVDAHYNLGCCYEASGMWAQAFASYEEAITRQPTHADSWEGLGKAMHATGNRAEAVPCFERAIALREQSGRASAESRYNMAYSLLSLGRWTEGWAAYESRFGSPVFMGTYVRRHEEPAWDGAPLEGRRLIVHAEQGFGDSLMMLRYVHRLEGEVVLEVQRPLVRLASLTFPGRVVIAQGDAAPVCDVQVATMSLPHLFGMTADNVPGTPYLAAPRVPLLPQGDGLRVGVCWAGSPDHRNDRWRSLTPEILASLLELPGVTWYSLQLGRGAPPPNVLDLAPLITDFADTAALIAQLDFVVACDTAVAHLAGALGIPTLLLLPAVPDFRWGLAGARTPWYPSLVLVRQRVQGEWGPVITRAAEAVRAAVEAR